MVFVMNPNNLQENVFQGGIFIRTTGHLAQILQRPFRHQATLIDNTYPCTEVLHDLHNMRGKEYSGTMLSQVLQNRTDHTRTDRINALKRLIKEKNLGMMDKCSRQSNLLAHAYRVVHDQFISIISESENT